MWRYIKSYRQFSLRTLVLVMFAAGVFCGAYRLGFQAGRAERNARSDAEFHKLIKLIESSITPTVWEDAGGAGTIMEFRCNTNCFAATTDPDDSDSSSNECEVSEVATRSISCGD